MPEWKRMSQTKSMAARGGNCTSKARWEVRRTQSDLVETPHHLIPVTWRGSLRRWISKWSADLPVWLFWMKACFFRWCFHAHWGCTEPVCVLVVAKGGGGIVARGRKEGNAHTDSSLTPLMSRMFYFLALASCRTRAHKNQRTLPHAGFLPLIPPLQVWLHKPKKIRVWWGLMVKWTHMNLLTSLLLSRWGLVGVLHSWWQLEAGKSHSVQTVDRNALQKSTPLPWHGEIWRWLTSS